MYFCTLNFYGGVAQLARAPALQAGGQEFDSPQLHHRRFYLLIYNIANYTFAKEYIEKYIDEIR